MPATAPATKIESATSHRGRRHRAGFLAPAAAWALAFLLLRIFAVSGYDWNTAFAVSTTIGMGDGLKLLFGSLMAGNLVLSILLVFVLPLLMATYLWSDDGRLRVIILAAVPALAALVALTVSFERWWLPVAASAVLGVFALMRRLPPTHRLRRASLALMARVGWIASVAMLLLAVLTRTPWVPHERIETTKGTVNGYVLSVDSGYLNVLTDDHEFVILISGDVLSRD